MKKTNKGDSKMRVEGLPVSVSCPQIFEEDNDGKDRVRKHGLGKKKTLIVIAIYNLKPTC